MAEASHRVKRRRVRVVVESSDSDDDSDLNVVDNSYVDAQASESDSGDEYASCTDHSGDEESSDDTAEQIVVPSDFHVAVMNCLRVQSRTEQRAQEVAASGEARLRLARPERACSSVNLERELQRKTRTVIVEQDPVTKLRAVLQMHGADTLLSRQDYWVAQSPCSAFAKFVEQGVVLRNLGRNARYEEQNIRGCVGCGFNVYAGQGEFIGCDHRRGPHFYVHKTCAYKLQLYARVWAALQCYKQGHIANDAASLDVYTVLQHTLALAKKCRP